MRAIHRKETILRQLVGEQNIFAWAHGALGRLSKGKIHCSCWMCRRKSYDEPQVRDKRAVIARLEEQQRVALLFFPAMVQSKQGGD